MKQVFLKIIIIVVSIIFASCVSNETYDLIIKNGTVVDGSGKDAYSADLAVSGDRIVKIGELSSAKAKQIIDAKGKYVMPGFIDAHSHADISLPANPSMKECLLQGITTVVAGNCGHGIAPLGEILPPAAFPQVIYPELNFDYEPNFFKMYQTGSVDYAQREAVAQSFRKHYGIELDWYSFEDYSAVCDMLPLDGNIAPLIGYSAVRTAVMGVDCKRDATPEEIEKLATLTEESMKQGAFGISTGYDPSSYATDDEFIRMLKIVKEYRGIFSFHTGSPVKGEGRNRQMEQFETMKSRAKAADVQLNAGHVMVGKSNNPEEETEEILRYFARMEAEGVDFSFDVIAPNMQKYVNYELHIYFHPFVKILGSHERLSECLRAHDFRDMIKALMKEKIFWDINNMIEDKAIIARHKNPIYQGKVIKEYARETGIDFPDFLMELLAQDPDAEVGAPVDNSDKKIMYKILFDDHRSMLCTDGINMGYCSGKYLRYIQNYNKRRFEDTIRQMSGFPADRFGITGRGVLMEGNFADILVLDYEKLSVIENDEDDDWKVLQTLDYVIVNGVITIEHTEHTGATAGRMLRKNQIINN